MAHHREKQGAKVSARVSFQDLARMPADSWMMAAAHKNLPMVVPGWEDSTLGNIYAARFMTGHIPDVHTVRSGIEYMMELVEWYRRESKNSSIGFFQIGG